jgi:hypothetical protein
VSFIILVPKNAAAKNRRKAKLKRRLISKKKSV